MGKSTAMCPGRGDMNSGFIFHRFRLCVFVIITGAVLSATGETLVFPPYGHSYGIRKATPKHLFMFFQTRTFFDNPQGLATARLDVWDDPKTENDDDEVVVYGVNSNRHQIIYNLSMWRLGLYGEKGSGEGQFSFPKGITADRHGNVYVADAGNNRVVRLKNPGSTLEWVRSISCKETGKQLNNPTNVGIDEMGYLYIADAGNRRIVRCDDNGKVIGTYPCRNAPGALAVADGEAFWSFFRNEQALFYVEGKQLAVKTDFSGKVLKNAMLPQGYEAAYGAIDYYHNYWVTDSVHHVVLKFDHNLSLLDIFGSYGKKDNQFIEPRGVAIYKRYGQVFVAEKKGAQYYWIGSELKAASITPASETMRYRLTVSATEYSFVSLFSQQNGDTCFYAKKYRVPPGNAVISIRGKGHDLTQEKVMLKIEPTYSSYSYYSWTFPVVCTGNSLTH